MQFGAAFTTLLERFCSAPNSPIVIAVSGGSDSVGLLHLSHHWAVQNDRNLLAVTVDHGLRTEAAAEARQVAALCDHLNIQHRTLVWQAPTANMSAARLARYRLLAEATLDVGGECLLTGHTFDDVVETALIRRKRRVRGGFAAGPSLAAPMPVWPSGRGITLLRPLLSVRRDKLQEWLETMEQRWIEDPSNENRMFERVRVRQFLARHPKLADLAGTAVEYAQTERAEIEWQLGTELEKVAVGADGLIDTSAAQPTAALMTLLVRCASGGDTDARAGAMVDLMASLTEPGMRQTLGGAWLQRTSSGFLIGRDPAMQGRGEHEAVFDGRYAKTGDGLLPPRPEAAFLVRHALPGGNHWREIISERIAHTARCLRTQATVRPDELVNTAKSN